jgi:hypothetical protein
LVNKAFDVFLGAGRFEVKLCGEKVWIGWFAVAA